MAAVREADEQEEEEEDKIYIDIYRFQYYKE